MDGEELKRRLLGLVIMGVAVWYLYAALTHATVEPWRVSRLPRAATVTPGHAGS
jgi:hypothetical protein